MTGRETHQEPEYEILTELHRTLTEAAGSFTEKLETLLAVGQSYLSMDAGLVASISGDQYSVEVIHSDHPCFDTVAAGLTVPLSETVCERTLQRGETYAIDDIVVETPELTERAAVAEYGGARYIGTPITIAEESYGTLCFYDTETHDNVLSERDRMVVEFMGQLVTYELEHHLQQERIRTTKNELESVFERIDDAVFAVDSELQITYVNDRAESVFGVERSQLVDRRLFEQFPAAKDTVFEQQFRRALDEQSTVTFEAPYEPLDAWFEVTAYPTETGLSIYFTEITARKQRRTELERYEQILDTVSDGVYALDEHERFKYVNEGLAELTGFDRQELVGSHIGMFKSDETIAAARSAVNEEIDRINAGNGTGEIEIDLIVETADNRQVPCQDHIALLPFDDRFRGSVGTLRDISDRVERERTLSGLLESTRALMVAETRNTVADEIVETVQNVLGFERAAVRWYDEEADQLVPITLSSTLEAELETPTPVQPGEGLVGSAFEAGEAAICEPVEPSSGTDAGATGLLAVVPLGEHGTLTVGFEDESGCDNSDRQLIELLAANAEAAFERTDRQQELRRYETLFETAQEMLCVLDSDGRFQLVTEPLADFVGHSRETLVETPIRTLLTADSAKALSDALESHAETDQTTISIAADLETAECRTVPIQLEVSKLPQALDQEFIISVHDRSELVSAKQAAAAERDRFSYLFENLTDPINEIEHTGRDSSVHSYNRAFQRLFGEPTVDDTADTGDVPDPLAVGDNRILEANTADQSEHDDRELKLQTAEGIKYFFYRQIAYELNGSRRRFEIYTDVTTLKQREIQLQVLHRLLRHNLRNDLNVVSGFADLLVEELETDRLVDFAERIASNVTDLIELSDTAKTIEDVASRQSLDRDPLAVDSMLSSLVVSTRAKHPEVSVSFTSDSSPVVAAGPHLRTAVNELLENAIEHNTADQPAVSLSVQQADGLVSITVSDNGEGIPDTEWKVVTGSSKISQLEHGSGLGLWLVRWVTEAYGGTLERDSKTEGGTVSILLPAVDTSN